MEGFIVDPRKSGPEEFQKGMRDVKLVFSINHTMPYTEEYDSLVKELFAGKIGEGSRVLPEPWSQKTLPQTPSWAAILLN